MSAPTISVIMAAYNGAALLPETLASLQAQTFGDFELIVVDDCSTDDTLALLHGWPDHRIRVIAAETNQGPVKTRNRAVTEARGRYLAALDQDDICLPDRFARQVAYLDAHPDTVLVASAAGTLCDGVTRGSTLEPVTTPLLVEWMLQIRNPLVWSSVMVRAEAARRLDPFTRHENLYAEDFDFYHRIARFGRIARIDDELLLYHVHAGGASKRYHDAMIASAARVLAEAHRPVLGEAATAAADLLARHVMAGDPVPDRATLIALGETIRSLQERFIADRGVTGDDLALIRWETARLWGRIGRAALRSGTIGVSDAIAVRPDHMGLGYARADEIVFSRLIGGAREIRRRAAL
ncbi:glycosyltransferase family 2 protein [Hephaestia sp. GCM10023244]|uniref:glycosyltransferase family 2 protein n=1 Tax=unclassified Hephaestia TaxID=2631281 RepID=UPI0020776256|nr:glycosyltransferase family A protein [Hephaestia sp. MAHUQ-44]MCM8729539.1 glycosyltransferase family 2 protein [Hephaestia sp. MAHUQ-44]